MSLPAPAPLAPTSARPTAIPLWAYGGAALAYLACSRLSLWATAPTDQSAPVWLGTGLSLWLTIRFGPRILAAILLSEITGNALDYLPTTGALDLVVKAGLAVGHLLTAYFGAWLWSHGQKRWHAPLGDFSEPLCCIIAALVAPLVATTVGTGALALAGGLPLGEAVSQWLAWWTGDAIGVLFLLPVLLTAPALWPRLRRRSARDFGRGAFLLGVSALTVAMIFGQSGGSSYLFVLFPLLVLATVWFGPPGVRLLVFLLAATGTAAARHGPGPWPTGEIWADLLTLQLSLSMTAVIALLLPVLHARKNLFAPLPRTLLLGGWALGGLVFGWLLKTQLRSDAADFGQLAFNAAASIEHQLVNYVAVLRRAESYVLGAPAVTRAGWGNFVQSLQLPTHYPGLRGVGLVYPVPPEELEDFLQRTRADESPDFTLHPLAGETLSRNQPHFILTHIVLVAPINQEPAGLDVGSHAQRRQTLEAARDSGQPHIAPRTNRTQAGSGFVLYLPIYAAGAPLTTVAERRAAFRAWVHAPFTNHEFMQGALSARSEKLQLHLFAAGPLDQEHLIYPAAPATALPPFERIDSRRLLGQEFTLAWSRGPAFVPTPHTPLIWLAASLSLGTVLLTGWVLSLQSVREHAEALAQARTAELRASERRSRLLVRAANVGFWDWDLLTGSVYFSPEWKSQLGYADHELPSRFAAWETRLHPEDRAATLAAVVDFQAGLRLAFDVEFRLLHRDSSWRWILTQAELTRDASGRVVRMSGSHIDITARKATEAALRASDQRFHDLVNSTEGIVWEADAKTFVCRSISANAERLLGYPLADWLQPGFGAGHIHPEDRAPAVQFYTSSTERTVVKNFEYRFTTADDRVIWLRDVVRVVSADGQPRWLRGLMLDITEQRTATHALRQNQALLLALTEGTSDAVYVKDLAGRYLLFNTAASRYAGKSAAEVLGHDDTALFSPEDAAHVMTDDQRVITSGRTQTYEEPTRSTALGVITFLSTKGPIRDAQGKIVGMFGIARNIIARKQAELALHASLKEKTALLKEVHHRVKNKLQVITSLLRLEGNRSTVPETKGVLTAMQSRIRAMAILHESLYQTGTFASVDLGAYLRNIVTQSFRMLNSAPGSVRLTLDLASFHVELDQAAPCGLLVNELLSNCLKHAFPAGRSGEVRIELQPVADSAQVCLRVSDDGIGLPPDFATKRGESLGLQLVGDLSEQLNATLVIGPEPAAIFAVTVTPSELKTPIEP